MPRQPDAQKIMRLLIGPALILILAAMFWVPISQLIKDHNRHTEIKLGPAGIDIISNAVSTAAQRQAEQGSPIKPGADQRAKNAAKQAIDAAPRLKGEAILWIDDHPENNIDLQKAFVAAGVEVFNALSNAQATQLISEHHFDLAITDVARDNEGPNAGLSLLPLLHENSIPTIIYSSQWAYEHSGQEHEFGVAQITNDPSELYPAAIAILARNGK